jgi:hypothetical protein
MATRQPFARIYFFAALATLAISPPCAFAQPTYGKAAPGLKLHLDRLVRAYPAWISGYDDRHLILKNGVTFDISDGRTDKTFRELLEQPDIDDMFYAEYPASPTSGPPAKNADPGRVRFEPLFTAMYGDCNKNGVRPKLRQVRWLPHHGGGSIAITTVNGVDKALEAVVKDLDRLPDELVKYLRPTSGTFNCRRIAGSSARSMHAYGAAIDINVKFSDYWRWSGAGESALKWKNRIPTEIVRIFQNHGFIWGGHWYHYDTMHFEYRPELVAVSIQ